MKKKKSKSIKEITIEFNESLIPSKQINLIKGGIVIDDIIDGT